MSDASSNRLQTARGAGSPSAPSADQAQAPGFRFGSEILQEAYDRLSFGARLLDLACLFRTEAASDGRTTVIACETWRLTKRADAPRIDVEVSMHGEGSEALDTSHGIPPPFPLLPATPKRSAWRLVLGCALEHFANTFDDAAAPEGGVMKESREHPHFPLMRKAFVSAKIAQLEKRLGPRRINSLSETLSKVIWKHVIDPDFVRIVAYARMLRPVTLQDYWEMAGNWAVFSAVYARDRYMLPLYQVVRFDEYQSGTPFSIARWTGKGVWMSRVGSVRLSSPAAYRVLAAMHPAIVRAWAEISWRRGAFATLFAILAELRDEGPISQPVLWSLVRALGGATTCWTFDRAALRRSAHIVRQYIRECRRRKAQRSIRSYRRALESMDLRSVLDWCLSGVRDAGELDSRTTWSSIERRSRSWHGRVAQTPKVREALAWASALPACEIAGVRVNPLTTAEALREEGRAMQHCAGSYAEQCAAGGYRVFALHRSTERATLGLYEIAGRWKVDQVRGMANGSPSPQMKGIATAVARAYTGHASGVLEGIRILPQARLSALPATVAVATGTAAGRRTVPSPFLRHALSLRQLRRRSPADTVRR